MSIFKQALEVLRVHGWTKGIRQDPDGRMCLLGAFDDVLNRSGDENSIDSQIKLLDPLVSVIQQTELYNTDPRKDDYNYGYWNNTDPEAYRRQTVIVAGYNNDPEVSFEDIEKALLAADQLVAA